MSTLSDWKRPYNVNQNCIFGVINDGSVHTKSSILDMIQRLGV